MKRIFLLFIAFIGMTVLIACQFSNPDAVNTTSPVAENTTMKGPVPGHEDAEEMVVTTPQIETAAPAPEQKYITVKAKNWSFEPSTINLERGDIVNLTISSEDAAYGISIPAFEIDLKLAAGETKTVIFIADQVGTFPFFCNVFCGSGHGDMRGQLVVQ